MNGVDANVTKVIHVDLVERLRRSMPGGLGRDGAFVASGTPRTTRSTVGSPLTMKTPTGRESGST